MVVAYYATTTLNKLTLIFPTVLKDARRDDMANITVTCTDNIKSRLDLWNVLKAVPTSNYRDYETPLY